MPVLKPRLKNFSLDAIFVEISLKNGIRRLQRYCPGRLTAARQFLHSGGGPQSNRASLSLSGIQRNEIPAA
jgi:hypothetical protein